MNQDGRQTAREAGLRYVSDEVPGIRRIRRGRHFVYVESDGTAVSDEVELARIKAIAVPPAYERVWICPYPNGHLQATAHDARGRKQYRYHPKWRAARDETKFHRMLEFAHALPNVRARIQHDLSLPGIPREKVLAAVVRLLEEATIRVGNSEYARSNDSYGLTTMLNRHAKVNGSLVRFSFKGKSGIKHTVTLRNRRLAKIIRACQDLPGQDLFAYLDAEAAPHSITSSDVNSYIREISRGDFTAKDFRTWVGTVQCALLLTQCEYSDSQSERKQQLNNVIKEVGLRLGNTPAVARKSYIHPRLISEFMTEGTIGKLRHAKSANRLLREERFVVGLLKKYAA